MRNKSKKMSLKKKISNITFPWWTKFIAYFLAFIFTAVSIFFIIIKGIEFGDTKCTKWLTSLVISFFTSIFLTEPIKVI